MMKQYKICLRALALVAALAFALSATAYDFQSGNVYYNITGANTVEVASKGTYTNSYNGWVNIPETVTYQGTTYTVTGIGTTAFMNSPTLEHVSLPKTIQQIGDLAFRNCPSLESVYCHAMTVPTLSESAFDASAYDEVTVRVPLSVYYTYAEAAVWQNLSSLDSLPYNFEKDGFYYYINEGNYVYVAQKEDKFNHLAYEGDITIPEWVTALNQTYFVRGIDVSAFWDCHDLTSVKMGRHVEHIESDAFSGCTSLTEVTIPASVLTIEGSTFRNCTGLTRVTIPESVTTIRSGAFSGCTGLEDIYCYAETPPTVYSSTFPSYNATLHVPDGCRSSYLSKNYWKNFNIVAMPTLNGALNVVEDAVEFECADYPWRVVEEGDRTYAISMNYGVPNSESSLYGYVNVPVEGGTLSFDFKAWGEGSSTVYDACLFFIDGVEKFRYGARDNDWETYSVDLAPGEHTLEWRYTKDNANNPEGDYFAVDNVQIVTNPEPYACYTESNTTLTFYYDTQRSSRPGTTYDLNTGAMSTDWEVDGTNTSVTKVVFDPSFANARPTTTYDWFYRMVNLQSITGMEYLNTSEVTKMSWMFGSCSSLINLDLSHFITSKVTTMTGMFDGCRRLTSLDLSSFNTSKVTDMSRMFWDNRNLRTIYVGDGWSTATVTSSNDMFNECTSLVGGQGTAYNSSNPMDKTYAHIDGGTSNPGYFTAEGDGPWTNPDEAYACYTPSYTTLTFYYDNQRSSRPGTTYDLNTGNIEPAWETDGTNASVTQVVFDPSFANARPTTTYDWFYGMRNLQSITGMSYLNTSEVTNMSFMFANCESLRSLDVSHFNTSQVIRMWAMFYGCSSLTSLDLSHFNTSQLMYMHYMFNGCSSLTNLDLSSFNTSYVMDVSYMFKNCSNLRTVYVGNGWSIPAVTISEDMFYNCTSLVGGRGTTWNSSNPTDKTYAHIDGGPSDPGYFTEFIEPYACYTESNTTLTFYYDTQRSSRPGTTYDLNTGYNWPGWRTDGTSASVTKVVFDPSFADARPTSTYDWFYSMHNLQSIEGMNYLNTNEVTEMRYMFCGCNKLTSLDVSHFNTSQLTTMRSMFDSCYGLTSLDLSSFNTSQVFNMGDMFHDCNNLRTIYVGSSWSTAAVTYSTNMFNGCTSLVGGQGTTYDADHVGAEYAHIDGGPSNPGYFTAEGEEPWTNPVAYACYTPSNTTLTFYYDNQRSSRPGRTYNLNTGAMSTDWEADGTYASVTKVVFDPSFAGARPTTTCDWFYGMGNLQSITGMSYLNTSEVTNMNWMFMECYKLTSLDVSHFNTAKVTHMTQMFSGCTGLTSLDVSSFNTSKVTYMNKMFEGSTNLRTIYVGNGWSTAAVTSSVSMFYDCTNLVGGQGTTYNASHVDKTYAHIDGGPSNPGYFTAKTAFQRGDVNGDNNVNITDVTALINYLLSGNATGINLTAANCNQDGSVNISDVTALIAFLLSGQW